MTPDELIEQVAKELERKDTREYGWTPEQFDVWWHHDPLNRNHHRQKIRAKAAISTIFAALQEPTEEMRQAYRDAMCWPNAGTIWRTMLNASPLGEQSE